MSLLKGLFGKKTPVKFSQYGRELDQNGKSLFSDQDAQVINQAHNLLNMQIMLSGSGRVSIDSEEEITPWVCGYITGVLDGTLQAMTGKKNADFELWELFLGLHFTNDMRSKAFACALACQIVAEEDDLFNPMFKEYVEGAKTGYTLCIELGQGDKSNCMGLASKLRELKA